MKFIILTLFPESFESYLNVSLLKRALAKKIIKIELKNLRDWGDGVHKSVDQRPYGGGAGMVLRVDIIDRALRAIKSKIKSKKSKVILLTPQGKKFDQKIAKDLSKNDTLILICGRYEGFDERIRKLVDMEISLGDFVLTGGEIPALAILDTVARLVPGVVGKEESLVHESFSESLLEYPQYTRPEVYRKQRVPKVLLTGHHAKIEQWRNVEALKRTKKRRPDMLRESRSWNLESRTMSQYISEKTDRLDKFLATVANVSRGKIQKAIKAGLVLVNQKVIIEPDFQIAAGDQIELPEFEPDDLKPSNLELKVVFENDDVAVIDKPAGLVVHPGAGNPDETLANALIGRYPGIEKVGEPHRPGIVHRLDEDTSGLILIAKNPDSYLYFKKIFLDRTVEKEYLALVHGVLPKIHGVIDLPIQRVPLKQKMKIGLGKPAKTEYWVLADSGQYSLLRVKLHTGRTHQIRVHLAHIGHPIVGDRLYGKKEDSTKLLSRQFLHAYKLKFQLPDGTWIELFSSLPVDLKEVLNKVSIIYHEN